MKIAALYVRTDTIYKTLGADCWDIERDARNYQGPNPVIAHPPCRAWGRLRRMAKPRPGEKECGLHAAEMVRKWGGTLEHPRASSLWKAAALPRPGEPPDDHGGFTVDVNQAWFGHRAEKRTWIYICGCQFKDVPAHPITFHRPPCVIANDGRIPAGSPGYRKEVTKREREATPEAFAQWLIAIAKQCRPQNPKHQP